MANIQALGQQVQVAQQKGLSDTDIVNYIAAHDNGDLGSKIAQGRQQGLTDADIVTHFATQASAATPAAPPPAPPANENAWQKGARLTAQAYKGADQSFRSDVASAAKKGPNASPIDEARPVLDAVAAGTAPIKGYADAAFGDKPVHLPPKIFGMDVPEWAQNINRNGLTGGDIAQFAIPVVGELNALRTAARAADAAGVTARTMGGALQASRAPASNAAAVAASKPANALQQTVDQFDKAKVRPSLAAATGGGNAAVANSFAENALAGSAARANMTGQVADVQASAQRIGQGYGQAADRTATGEAVQQGVKDFNDRFSKRAGKLYDQAFDTIDTAMAGKTGKPRIATVFDDSGTHSVSVGGSQITTPAASAALGGMGQAQSKAIATVIKDPTVSRVAAALTDANQAKDLSFQDLRNLRTWVRTAQDNNQLRQDIGAANLQRLEGALTQDIYTNAQTLAGPKAVRQLQQADTFYRLGSQRIQNSLQAFLGKDNLASGESAYDRVLRAAGNAGGADSARLAALKTSLKPNEWGDVASSVINRMGAPTKGAANANDADAFSLAGFVGNYAELSDRGKGLLFGQRGAGGLRDELDNLVSVAGKVKAVEKGANASKSGVSIQNASTLSGLAGATGAALMGHPAGLALGAAGLGAMHLTGDLLTNPKAVRLLADLGKAKTPQAVASQVRLIDRASAKDAALLPLAQAARAFQSAGPVPAAASTSQEQSTP